METKDISEEAKAIIQKRTIAFQEVLKQLNHKSNLQQYFYLDSGSEEESDKDCLADFISEESIEDRLQQEFIQPENLNVNLESDGEHSVDQTPIEIIDHHKELDLNKVNYYSYSFQDKSFESEKQDITVQEDVAAIKHTDYKAIYDKSLIIIKYTLLVLC